MGFVRVEEKLPDETIRKACDGSRADLKKCLLDSDCVKLVNIIIH